MNMAQLTWFEEINGQALEIVVKYDVRYFEVENITGVYYRDKLSEEDRVGRVVCSIWPLMREIPEMEVAIEKIVARVDWRELYAETVNQ